MTSQPPYWIERDVIFYVTSLPPCWMILNKRFLFSILYISSNMEVNSSLFFNLFPQEFQDIIYRMGIPCPIITFCDTRLTTTTPKPAFEITRYSCGFLRLHALGQRRKLHLVKRQVKEQRLAGDWLEFWRESGDVWFFTDQWLVLVVDV